MASASAPTFAGQPPEGSGDFRVPANWNNVRAGMSAQQVIAILGEPTSRPTSPDRFIYDGVAGDSGVVRGSVTFYGGRMASASAPTF